MNKKESKVMLRHLLENNSLRNRMKFEWVLSRILLSLFYKFVKFEMSLSNSTRISIELTNVDVFIFGKSSLYGYDSLNHCIIVHSLIEINNISINRYHLSSSPTWPIQRLILNQDETILSLLAEQIVYLVYLPKFNLNSPSKG
jgi:hypothetical protein